MPISELFQFAVAQCKITEYDFLVYHFFVHRWEDILLFGRSSREFARSTAAVPAAGHKKSGYVRHTYLVCSVSDGSACMLIKKVY